MAVYTCEVGFEDAAQLTDQNWSNIWYVLSDDSDDAHAQCVNIATLSAMLLPNNCNVISAYSHSPGIFNSGLKTPLGVPGSRTPTGDRLPAWNVVQMRLPTSSIRPVLKYLRCGMTEDDIEGQNVEAALIDTVFDFGVAVSGIPGLCTINGLIVSGGPPVVTQRVCMRQMGWRRRARPGFKRGWVPA